MTFTFIFHADPGHGWMEFPKGMLNMLNPSTVSRITGYSYHNKEAIFLEEDSDAPLVVEALRAKGHTVAYHEKTYNDEAPIRNMALYPGKR